MAIFANCSKLHHAYYTVAQLERCAVKAQSGASPAPARETLSHSGSLLPPAKIRACVLCVLCVLPAAGASACEHRSRPWSLWCVRTGWGLRPRVRTMRRLRVRWCVIGTRPSRSTRLRASSGGPVRASGALRKGSWTLRARLPFATRLRSTARTAAKPVRPIPLLTALAASRRAGRSFFLSLARASTPPLRFTARPGNLDVAEKRERGREREREPVCLMHVRAYAAQHHERGIRFRV